MTQDLEERARLMKARMSAYKAGSPAHLSDSETYLSRTERTREPRSSCGDRARGDLHDRPDRFREFDRGHHRGRRRGEYSMDSFTF